LNVFVCLCFLIVPKSGIWKIPNFVISDIETYKHLQVVLYDNMNDANSFWTPKTVQ